MSFLFKKVIKPWNSTKANNPGGLSVPDMPELPPSPDLSHLTQDEILVINDVIKRQEEFDRQEANRVQRIKDELENMQEKLTYIHDDRPERKVVDLRLCRLCFKTKFADGVGRVCYDCQQRVCQQCGAFSKQRRTSRKAKSIRRRWRCKLCLAKREVLCRTGGWYHGLEVDSVSDLGPVGDVRKKLSLVSMEADDRDYGLDYGQFYTDDAERSDFDREATGDTDLGSSTFYGNDTNNEGEIDSERCPSGNRTDSELTRKRYLPHANSVPTYDYRDTPRRPPPRNNNNETNTNGNHHIHYQQFKQSIQQQPHHQSTPRNHQHHHHHHQQQLQQQRQHHYQKKSGAHFSADRVNSVKSISGSGACAKNLSESKRQTRRRSLPAETKPRPGLKDSKSTESSSILTETKVSRSLDTEGSNHKMNGGLEEGAVTRSKYFDDDDDSLESLILERRMSMRKRKEKRQRKKLLRTGQEQRSTESLVDTKRFGSSIERSKSPSRHYGTDFVLRGEGQRRDSVTRSMLCHSNSLTSCARKASPINEGHLGIADTTSTSTFSSFRDSSMSDRGTASPSLPRSPATFRTMRQDAFSLNSSCLSLGSGNEARGRDSGRGHPRSPVNTTSRSRDSLHSQSLQVKQLGRVSPKQIGETSLQKWTRAGFQDVYLVTLLHHSKEPQFGVRLSGGVQDNLYVCRALVTSVATDLKAKICEGHEVLEWNGETLRGQSFDHVVSVTLQPCPQVVLLLHPFARKDTRSFCDEPTVLLQSLDKTPCESPELQIKTAKRRMLPRTPVQMKRQTHRTQGELQLSLLYQASRATLAVTVLQARDLASPLHGDAVDPSPMVVLSLGPEGRHMKRETLETETRQSTGCPDWEQTFLLDGVTLTEVVSGALQVTVWSQEDKQDIFLGEVLIDLIHAQLDNQTQWYRLEEHDENSMALPKRRSSYCTSRSASLTSGSIRDGPASSYYSPNISPEVPSHRRYGRSPSLIGSAEMSPVPSGQSCVGSRDSVLNIGSQPDTFTTKVRKKMLNTVSKMSSLSLLEKRECSDESSYEHQQNVKRRLSDRDWSGPTFINPSPGRSRHSSHNSMDLLAPPKPPTRNNSSCSFLTSDDDDAFRRFSASSACSDRPPPEGDDVTSNLGPGQIPPKANAEMTICGDIKLGFMVSKGQLEVDIICAMGLHKSGSSQPPDTYVKTYLVEGRKVIQRKKTLVVKASYDPIYNKKLKYSACNVHGRIMKVDVWERVGSFEKKCCRGEVLVRLDGLDLCRHTVAWYKLFQINSTDYGSDEFLNVW